MIGYALPADEALLEGWPRKVNGARDEPGSGVVRILREGGIPIVLATEEVRLLAEHAATRRQRVLYDAADEADRQRDVLIKVLEEEE